MYELSDEVVKIIVELCGMSLITGGLKNKEFVDKVLTALQNKKAIPS